MYLRAVATALLATAWAGAAAAVDLAPGDILVLDKGAGTIVRIDPGTGAQEPVPTDPIGTPDGLAVDAAGQIFVSNTTVGPVIHEIDPATGEVGTFAEVLGASTTGLRDVEIESSGDLLVADAGASGGPGQVFRVDRVTRDASALSTGDNFVSPQGLAIASNGDIFVSDASVPGVVKVDPITGNQELITEGENLVTPFGIVVHPSGDLLVIDYGSVGVVRVDPATGAQQIVTQGVHLRVPIRGALDSLGDLLVVDQNALQNPGEPSPVLQPAVVKVDLLTGEQTILAAGGDLGALSDIEIVPAPEPPVATGCLAALLAVACASAERRRRGRGRRGGVPLR